MRLCCVIPTYNNRPGLEGTLRNLLDQTRRPDEVLVVDNGGEGGWRPPEDLFPGVRYIRMPRNAGSAGGYYEGIKAAASSSDLIFLSDDDNLYRPDALEKLEAGIRELPAEANVGAVRCAWETFTGGKPLEVEDSLWSGSMLRAAAVRRIGLPLKELFLYAEDTEYFLRLRKNGFSIYVLPEARYLNRTAAHKRTINIPFRPALVYKDAFRLYYAFRNEVYVDRLYQRGGAARILLYFLKIAPFIGFSAAAACVSGLLDGFRGRLGENVKYEVRR